jgi:hypothetical protein
MNEITISHEYSFFVNHELVSYELIEVLEGFLRYFDTTALLAIY